MTVETRKELEMGFIKFWNGIFMTMMGLATIGSIPDAYSKSGLIGAIASFVMGSLVVFVYAASTYSIGNKSLQRKKVALWIIKIYLLLIIVSFFFWVQHQTDLVNSGAWDKTFFYGLCGILAFVTLPIIFGAYALSSELSSARQANQKMEPAYLGRSSYGSSNPANSISERRNWGMIALIAILAVVILILIVLVGVVWSLAQDKKPANQAASSPMQLQRTADHEAVKRFIAEVDSRASAERKRQTAAYESGNDFVVKLKTSPEAALQDAADVLNANPPQPDEGVKFLHAYAEGRLIRTKYELLSPEYATARPTAELRQRALALNDQFEVMACQKMMSRLPLEEILNAGNLWVEEYLNVYGETLIAVGIDKKTCSKHGINW